MGLANPWLLLGLAALAAPVLVHLVQREERAGRAFPSLMFVRRVPFELRRRRTLRDRALLALRCLALAAVVLAFASPYWNADVAPFVGIHTRSDVVWLLDRSYSMSPPQRWDSAVGEIRKRIEGLKSGERAALIAFDDEAQVISGVTDDRAVLRDALARIEPGRRGTGLTAAFRAAEEILAASGADRRRVVIVSDLQRSALDAAGMLALGESADLEIAPITGPIGANATVLGARVTPGDEAEVEDALVIRVRNTGDAALVDARIELTMGGRTAETRPLSVDPGAERAFSFPIVLRRERPTPVTIRVGPDALPADDRYHAVLAARRPLVAALAEPDQPRRHQGVFLEEALRVARGPAVDVRRIPARGIDEALLAEVDVLILDDVALPSASIARSVMTFLSRGGGVLIAAGPETDTAPIAGPLASASGAVVTREGSGARIETPAVGHPLWAATGLEGGHALTQARVTTTRRLEPGPAERVLARLGDGAPLLVEATTGAGRVLTLATSADPRWGTLALEPGFVPFVHAAVTHLAGGGHWRSAYTTGEVIDLQRHAGGLPRAADWRSYLANGGAVVVENPAGVAERVDTAAGSLFTARIPGIHEVHRADGRGPALPFAVNTGRAESLLAAAAPGELERRVVRRSGAAQPRGTDPMPDHSALFDPVWWLLVLAGFVLMMESMLAHRLSRRRPGSAAGAHP